MVGTCALEINKFIIIIIFDYIKIDLVIFNMTMNSAQCLFRELPYYGIEVIEHHGQFNNSLNNNLTTKKQLQCLKSLHDVDVISLKLILTLS